MKHTLVSPDSDFIRFVNCSFIKKIDFEFTAFETEEVDEGSAAVVVFELSQAMIRYNNIFCVCVTHIQETLLCRQR
jgi:hypothetical protein